MNMTQKEFDERAKRVDEGTGDDEDRRLVKQFRDQGWERGGDKPDTVETGNDTIAQPTVTAVPDDTAEQGHKSSSRGGRNASSNK